MSANLALTDGQVMAGVGGLPQQDTAAFQQLLQGLRPQGSEPFVQALVGDGSELLGHGEAALPQPGLGGRDFEVERAAEIGAGEGNASERPRLARFS